MTLRISKTAPKMKNVFIESKQAKKISWDDVKQDHPEAFDQLEKSGGALFDPESDIDFYDFADRWLIAADPEGTGIYDPDEKRWTYSEEMYDTPLYKKISKKFIAKHGRSFKHASGTYSVPTPEPDVDDIEDL